MTSDPKKYGTDLGHAAALVGKWQLEITRLERDIMEHYVHIGSITEQQARDALAAIGASPKRIADWIEQNPPSDKRSREDYQLVANDPDRLSTYDELAQLEEDIAVRRSRP